MSYKSIRFFTIALFAFSLLPLATAPCLAAPERAAQLASQVDWEMPFQTIRKVQEQKIPVELLDSHDAAKSRISIPYTRVNIVVRNGIAFTRIIQIYHNHGTENEGYAFSLPTSDDSHITQFNLWDRGERYIGSIEERTRAEEVYRSITGDETPSMAVDPGLVRKNLNRFELRVFPIYPGENKQIELITHERLSFSSRSFIHKLPLSALLQSADARHPGAKSMKTEISLQIEDELPIDTVELNGHPPVNGLTVKDLREEKRNDHSAHYRFSLPPSRITDLEINYSLKLPPTSVSTVLTFADQGEQFFALRTLAPIDQQLIEQQLATMQKESMKYIKGFDGGEKDVAAFESSLPEPDRPPFYIAVWRKPGQKNLAADMPELDLELAGYQTFLLFNKKRFFHASWLTADLAGKQLGGPKYMTITTNRSYPVPMWMLPVSKGMKKSRKRQEQHWAQYRETGKQPKPQPVIDNYENKFAESLIHLKTSIRQDKCPTAYLFLDDLGPERLQRLTALLKTAPQTKFLIVTEQPIRSITLGMLANVNLFSLENGWDTNRSFNGSNHLLSSSQGQQIFAAMGLPSNTTALKSLWKTLPEIDPAVARWELDSSVSFSDVYYYTGIDRRMFERALNLPDKPKEEIGSHTLAWLVGRYEGAGNGKLTLYLPAGLPAEMGMFSFLQSTPTTEIATSFSMPKAESDLRFVGSFVGSAQAADLDAEIRMLTAANRGWRQQPDLSKLDPAKQAKLAKLRKEIVALSRRFSFISNETAFIALPENLRKEHGIKAQKFEMGQLYGKKGDSEIAVVPEPSTNILLMIALSGLLFAYRGRMSRVSHKHPHRN